MPRRRRSRLFYDHWPWIWPVLLAAPIGLGAAVAVTYLLRGLAWGIEYASLVSAVGGTFFFGTLGFIVMIPTMREQARKARQEPPPLQWRRDRNN